MDPYALEFDWDYWSSLFPMEESGADACWGSVYSPPDVCEFQRYRDRICAQYDLGASVPADIFVLGRGSHPTQMTTQIGGLPYWPKEEPWPTRDDGKPMMFLCQLRLAESADILPDMPGDLLQVFVDGDAFFIAEPSMQTRFVWRGLNSIEGELVDESDIPESGHEFLTAYGARHRTQDFPSPEAQETMKEVLSKAPDIGSYPASIAARLFRFTGGLKVGGASSLHSLKTEQAEWVYIGCISTAYAGFEEPYPFLNVSEPYAFDTTLIDKSMSLDVGDGFRVHFFLDQDHEVRSYWAHINYDILREY